MRLVGSTPGNGPLSLCSLFLFGMSHSWGGHGCDVASAGRALGSERPAVDGGWLGQHGGRHSEQGSGLTTASRLASP